MGLWDPNEISTKFVVSIEMVSSIKVFYHIFSWMKGGLKPDAKSIVLRSLATDFLYMNIKFDLLVLLVHWKCNLLKVK